MATLITIYKNLGNFYWFSRGRGTQHKWLKRLRRLKRLINKCQIFNLGFHLAVLCLLYTNLDQSNWLYTWFKSVGELQFTGLSRSSIGIEVETIRCFTSSKTFLFLEWFFWTIPNLFSKMGSCPDTYCRALKIIMYYNVFLPKEC